MKLKFTAPELEHLWDIVKPETFNQHYSKLQTLPTNSNLTNEISTCSLEENHIAILLSKILKDISEKFSSIVNSNYLNVDKEFTVLVYKEVFNYFREFTNEAENLQVNPANESLNMAKQYLLYLKDILAIEENKIIEIPSDSPKGSLSTDALIASTSLGVSMGTYLITKNVHNASEGAAYTALTAFCFFGGIVAAKKGIEIIKKYINNSEVGSNTASFFSSRKEFIGQFIGIELDKESSKNCDNLQI